MNKLTPAQDRALDQLRGTLHGKVRKGAGIQLATARVLHRLGLAYLDETAFGNGDWLLTLVEPVTQEITDEDLLALDPDEATVLWELDAARRYRALRHAHIAASHFGDADRAAGYPQLARTRLQALRERVHLVSAWRRMEISDRQYGQHVDLAGQQWKAARETPTNTWNAGKGWGEGLLTVEAATYDEAYALVEKTVAADPVGYRELVGGFGLKRLTVQEWADARRVREAALAA
jgi:hypothetical protein